MYMYQLDLLLEAEEQIQQKKLIQWDKIAAWFRTQQTNIQTRWKQFKLDLQKRLQKEPEKKGVVQKGITVVQNGCKEVMKGCNEALANITGQKDFNLLKQTKSMVDGALQNVGQGIANILANFKGEGQEDQQQEQQQPAQDQQQQ